MGESKRKSGAKLRRKAENDVLAGDLDVGALGEAELGQPLEHLVDQELRRRRARGQSDGLVAAEPGGVEVGLVVDQVGIDATVARDLHEPVRVRARARADDEHERRLLADALDGVLAILRRVADVRRGWPNEIREALSQRVDDVGRIVERERGLCDVGDLLALLDLEVARVFGGFHEDDRLRRLPHRALELAVARVPDQRDLQAAARIAARLRVHLGDERADRVDDLEPAFRALLVDPRRDAVRREDNELALGHLVLGFDENGAAGLEVADDMDVVDDLVAHVDGRAMLLEQLLDDVDRAYDSGAEASRRRDEHTLAHDSSSAARVNAAVALRASRAVRIDLTGSVTNAVATTFQSVPPSGFPAQTSRPTGCPPESETARTTPASRPVDAST